MATLQDHIESIQLYVQHGCEPGSCTRAILENDLVGAVSHADPTTSYILADIVRYCYNKLPMDAWGSKERVRAHMAKMREQREREANERTAKV